MPKHQTKTRREFIQRTAAAVAFPTLIPASALGKQGHIPPSNRITLGFIGTGDHGVNVNLKSFLAQPGAQCVALCDVDAVRLQHALDVTQERAGGGAKGFLSTGDWREVIARADIDAVMISTPDHWHVPISVAAIRAGKDVCCEKPTLTIQEGRVLADTVQRHGAVFQTSTEDRAVAVYRRMAERVRNKRVGKLHTIRVQLWSGHRVQGGYSGVQKPQPVPKGFDYDMWLGPAPEAFYTPGRCHFNFRWIQDYAGGMLTDWGAHLIDTAQWGNDTEHTGPISVAGEGVFPADGLYDTATEFHLEYEYANGVRLLIDSGGCSIRFEGTEGWVGNNGWRGPLEASSKAILNAEIGPGELHLYTPAEREHRDFLDCVKSRRDPYFPAEIGHRMCTVLHLGNIAMKLGRKLRWDPDAEFFVDDPEANRMRARAMRGPWSL